MTITTYRNASPTNKAVKSLTTVDTIEGDMREDSSIVEPEFVFRYSGVPTFNYFTVSAFSRSYFVTDLISVGNSLWMVRGHCDVLSSFWNEIRTAECIIARSSSNRNPLLIDDKLMVTARSRYGTKKSSQQPLMGGTATRRFVMILPGSGTGAT